MLCTLSRNIRLYVDYSQVISIIDHLLRRWPNIKSTLGQRLVFSGLLSILAVSLYSLYPRRHETFTQCWCKVGRASTTLAQHHPSTGWMFRVYCIYIMYIGTWDFFGLNHYTTRYVRPPSAGEDVGEDELRQLLNLMEEADPAWPKWVQPCI